MTSRNTTAAIIYYVDLNGALPLWVHQLDFSDLIAASEALSQRALKAQALSFASSQLDMLAGVMDYEEEYENFDSAAALVMGLVDHMEERL